jgi:hypothetical protein
MRNYWKRRKVQKPLSRKLSLGRRGGAVNSKKNDVYQVSLCQARKSEDLLYNKW